ncbi:Hydroxyacylglutathione hydrolase [Candidatus Anstonella stagnisolia]|nr:Hydroxyacylglutathione hydrolase [Candidatus Anstonella stagnisolia]
MFEKIAKGIYMLQTDERVCSTIYMLDGGKEGKAIIDSGDGKVLLDFEPKMCILTHGHYDHTRGVEESWKEVYLHPEEKKDAPFIFVPKNAKALEWKKKKFGEFELEIFHTPGHTMGSVCIFERKSGILFSGDTKFSGGEHGRTDLQGSDELMQESLALIEKIPYKLLCPGHDGIEEREK